MVREPADMNRRSFIRKAAGAAAVAAVAPLVPFPVLTDRPCMDGIYGQLNIAACGAGPRVGLRELFDQCYRVLRLRNRSSRYFDMIEFYTDQAGVDYIKSLQEA